MSFNSISKISLYLSLIFILSCQDTISSLRNNDNIEYVDDTYQLETDEFLDFNIFIEYQDNVIDNYTYNASDYNFLDKDLAVIKINNYEAKYNNNNTINVIYLDKTSDGKSIMSLILLEAGYGAEIEICAEGYDEKVAVHKLVEFVEQKFGELE